jgi:hypothetical protein
MKRYLLLIWILCFLKVECQPPSFYTAFGGEGEDVAYSGKVTVDKQYIIAGSSSSYGSYGVDMFVAKVDLFGFPSWQKFIGGMGIDVAKSIIQLPDSGFVIAGYTNSFGAGGYDAYIVRTDKFGSKIWEKTYGGNDWDFASDVILAPDGNIVVVGNTSSFGAGKKDGFMIKYDVTGNFLGQTLFGGVEDDDLRSIIVTNDGFLAAVGLTQSKGEPNGDGYFLKLKLNGDTIFTRTVGGPFEEYFNDLVQKNTDEYNLCGAGTFTANTPRESFIYSMTSTGVRIHDTHLIHGTENEEMVSATNSKQLTYNTAYLRNAKYFGFKKQGEVLVLYPNLYAYRVNDNGGTEDEMLYSIESTDDGGYLAVGYTTSFNSIGKDIYIMKYDSAVKENYISVVGVRDVPKQIPKVYYSGKILTIDYSENGFEAIEIQSIEGIVVYSRREKLRRAEIDISSLSSNFYILRIESNGRYYSKKIIR